MTAYLLVNFGGPRDVSEIGSFLIELLTDRDVIRTPLPTWVNRWLFTRIAKKRAKKIAHDYEKIGGRSPIYFDTEELAKGLRERLEKKVVTFHRYLPKTHGDFLEEVEGLREGEIVVLPLFPQFCYGTTGSIARFFEERLSPRTAKKLRWIKSYAGHPSFVLSYQRKIADFLKREELGEEEVLLLFSAHGVPRSFIEGGDLYEAECRLSFEEVMKGFPQALGLLSFQSKFGPGEWLRPYTNEVCEAIETYTGGRKKVVIVPISFTSDHIETLFEVEEQYLPPIRERGLQAYRCPALNLEPFWIEGLLHLLQGRDYSLNPMLVRRGR